MKAMTMFAAAMFAGVAMAEGVASTEIVGYSTTDLESDNFTMFAVPFVHVNGDAKGLMLNSDITVANATKHNMFGSADQIWVWVPEKNGYDKFFIDAAGVWKNILGSKPKFEDTEGYQNGLPLGAAVYYKAKTATDKKVTFSGAVESESEVELPLTADNYTMIANPYPTALFLNDGNQVEFANATKHNMFGSADQIWVWSPAKNGYDKFFINAAGVWKNILGSKPDFESTEGYAKGLPVGKAFYYKAKAGANKSVTFKKSF